ncbi:SLC13 family permease [Hoeflea prorocentri]|uniref:SLC13 family permease n=1 Tax=Hoeflea prorocentri TaxID=1922333 RepID=A0A9X3UFZ8_9HYPH|nr:SLC13 family permease [Hoeflea prorocentri]MCY6380006.1 SLC13 family permease [Hoeflea prorocentri]MDA5397806.1 SLC13 family permease [Hoeflea prorocentri]
MSVEQIQLFILFAAVFALLFWGRWRYDLIAFSALLVALVLGLVPTDQAFSGFGHPATVIVALVLVISRGLLNSGAIDLITRQMVDAGRSVAAHIAVMSGVGAVLSAFMNNVAAMALLMPVDLQAAKKAGRPVRRTLMPLSFATILGGMVTLIGTPPNIIIASFRERALGEPFGMFAFTPVGGTVAIIGIAFVALIGWRLIPKGDGDDAPADDLRALEGFLAELVVPEKSKAVGQEVRDLYPVGDEDDVAIIGVVRNGKRLGGFSSTVILRPNDMLIVEATAEDIDRFRGTLGLEFLGERPDRETAAGDLSLMEVVVPRESRLAGRSAISMRLRARRGVTLLGISRKGKRFSKRVRHETVRAGDILLLLGSEDRLPDVANWLGVLPLAERGLNVTQHRKAWLAVGVFAAAISISAFGLLYLATALAIVVALYIFLDIVPIRSVYDHIEWPVVVLLGSMIPLGVALENAGGTQLIAIAIVDLAAGLPSWVVLTALMLVVMTLSDVLNNTATAVIGAPIAVDIASRLNANPDGFLMAVAVAASCAFLTPIGHKNNTLILGPGGYKFGDYWRMGLPLEVVVVAVSVPVILMVFPL